MCSPGDPSASPSAASKSRRSLYVGVVALLIIGAVLGIVLGVTLGGNGNENNNGKSIANAAETSSSLTNSDLVSDNDSVDCGSPSPTPTPSIRGIAAEPSPSSSSISTGTTSPTGTTALTTPSTGSAQPVPVGGVVPTISPTTATPTQSPVAQQEEFGEIVMGTTTDTNVDFYRCHTTTAPSSTVNPQFQDVSIVLLHGGSFSKENWLDAGILDTLCTNARTVVALDLSVGANRDGLKNVLTDLSLSTKNNNNNDKLLMLPVDFLVTPSASGYSIVDWMMNGNVLEMPDFFTTWVPVATGSLASATDDQIRALSGIINILAINGNEDTAGAKYSNRLGDLAGATVVELAGRHAVYLQSPNEFAQTILDHHPSSQ